MDAITLLKQDHRTVNALFKKLEKLGDRAYVSKRAVLDDVIEELWGTQPSRNRSYPA